jgi:glycosyltransferase involved in cell wall biosynthesis
MKKNLVILSDHNLWYGNSAASVRIKNYALSVACEGDRKVYLLCVQNFRLGSEWQEVAKGVFTNLPQSFDGNKWTNKIKSNIRFAKSLNKWNKLNNEKCVFLVYNSVNFSFEFLMIFVLKILNKNKVFYELNEVRIFGNHFTNPGFINRLRWLFDFFKFLIMQLFWFFYDGIICISKNIQRYSQSYCKNQIVIPILCEIDEFSSISKSSDFTNKLKILFTGSINIKKENLLEFLYCLIDFDKIYPNWSFDLCGVMNQIDQIYLNSFVKKNKLENKVNYLGNLNHDDALKMQKCADLLVLPRKNNLQNYYGFSTKLSEYAVSGVITLLTNTGVMADYFKDQYNCLMTDGYKKENFLTKLLELVNLNNNDKEIIVRNAYITAEKYFNYRNYSTKLIDFLEI